MNKLPKFGGSVNKVLVLPELEKETEQAITSDIKASMIDASNFGDDSSDVFMPSYAQYSTTLIKNELEKGSWVISEEDEQNLLEICQHYSYIELGF